MIENRADPVRVFDILDAEKMMAFEQRNMLYVKRHSDSNPGSNQINRFSVNTPEVFVRLPKVEEKFKSFQYKLEFSNKS